jgi:hypothetical protein
MTHSIRLTNLVRIFRSGLLALLPVMDAAQIRWAGPDVYDPWEDVERTLFSSIIGSCVANQVGGAAWRPLAVYGLNYADYEAHSFISEHALRAQGKPNALVALQTNREPFDTALLRELNANLVATGQTISKPVDQCTFDLAIRGEVGIDYHESITYFD